MNDPDPYSEKQDNEFSSQMMDEQKKRKLDNHIFYQFTHGSHPDLHSNINLNGSRSDLASVVKAGYAPAMTPNTVLAGEHSAS